MRVPLFGKLREQLVLGFMFVALTVYSAYEFKKAPLQENVPTYLRVGFWLESAECYLQTGVPLVGCVDGKIVPIEDFSRGDDRGHTIFLNALTFLSQKIPTRLDLIYFNIVFHFLSVATLIFVLYRRGFQFAALAFFAVAMTKAFSRQAATPDVVSCYTACASLMIAAQLLLSDWLKPQEQPRSYRSLAGALLLFAGIGLIREPIGFVSWMAIGLTIFGVGAWQLYKKRLAPSAAFRFYARGGVLLILIYIALILPTRAALSYRDLFHENVPKPTAGPSHGVYHNLMIGLGTEPNPWGIVWQDEYAFAVAEAVQPGVSQFSREYMQIMRDHWVHAVLSEPWAALRVYTVKTWRSLVIVMQMQSVQVALGFFALYLYFVYRKTRRRPQLQTNIEHIGLWVCFMGLLSQGILGLPAHFILAPAGVAAILAILTSVQNQSGIFAGKGLP